MPRIALAGSLRLELSLPLLALLMLLAGPPALGQENAARGKGAKPPNILLILCDDMGWRDLSCFGNDRVATANVDRLAAEGIKLTQFYAASCRLHADPGFGADWQISAAVRRPCRLSRRG